MKMAKNDNEVMLETILCYKTMALDHSKHDIMLKDKTVLQFLAYSLDSEDNEITEASLKTIELLVHNNKNHNVLRSTFGVSEALKATSEREGLEDVLKSLAQELVMKLEDAPAFHTRYRTMKVNPEQSQPNVRKLSSKVYSFHVFGLNEDTRKSVESAVIRIRGVISVIIDTGHQRCVVRVMENITPQILIEHIAKETKLEARLIQRNKFRQEVLIDLGKPENGGGDDGFEDANLPEYLPEEESPVKEKALYSFGRLRTSAASWVRTATSLFQNSFYW
uniref:Armadillo repeat-containing protein 1-like protein n=2 Tax=Triatoma infestans TaxID=30076 RepID=A0A171AZK2_TRIIF